MWISIHQTKQERCNLQSGHIPALAPDASFVAERRRYNNLAAFEINALPASRFVMRQGLPCYTAFLPLNLRWASHTA
jgi:hypothetical protein